jgi:hypothetical protein
VSENRVLRRIFGFKREAATADRKKFTEKLHNLYSAPDIRLFTSRRMRWVGYVVYMGEMRNA